MVITVVGLGFVGLTAALGFAAKGHRVYGVEKDAARRTLLQRGMLPFQEPVLGDILRKTLGTQFSLHGDQETSVPQSDCVFYCVGTPVGEGGSADLRYLTQAVQETLPLLDCGKHTALIIKSTVPPGTLRDCVDPLVRSLGYCPGQDLELVNNPEFLREGSCWEDFIHADRLVIGASSDRGFERAAEVYRNFSAPLFRVSPTTAEFIKYLSNTLLATMVSFSNEMANAALQIGDVEVGRAFQILHQDRRWEQNNMSSYVYPGCGYGGYCLPKDTQAMLYAGTSAGAQMPILDAVIQTNQSMPEHICQRLLDGISVDSPIGILGLSFKPFTDDVRDSPAARLIACLRQRGVQTILAFDPMAETAFARTYPELSVEYPGSMEDVANRCVRTGVVTAWPEFLPVLDHPGVLDFRYMRR